MLIKEEGVFNVFGTERFIIEENTNLIMVITIREYEEKDKEKLVSFMDELQDHLIIIDPLRRLRRLPKYGLKYTLKLLHKIGSEQGIIFFAEENKLPIGVIVGLIERQKKEDLLGCIPTKMGRIQELFVGQQYRSKGVGKLLMETLEDYFKKKKCTIIKVEIFAPNNKAHQFYGHYGFENRIVDMIKVIEK